MILSKIVINNFRNFQNIEINLNNHSLVIGANDVGKSNLLRAIRLILDKSLSQIQYDADDSDYCIYTDKNYIKISLEFTIGDLLEDEYIVSKFGIHIKDGKFYVVYHAQKEKFNVADFYIGFTNDIDYMTLVQRSFITSVISCVYLESTRDFQSYIKKSKAKLIKNYKNVRTDEEIDSDEIHIGNANSAIASLNSEVENISFIEKPMQFVTSEIQAMSKNNENMDIKISAFNELDDLIKNTNLISKVNGKNIEINGDGRKNQIYMSMWFKEGLSCIQEKKTWTIYMIEEPESHLHLPLQTITLRHLLKGIVNQILITSHSPKVALEFDPESLVRLYKSGVSIKAAQNGCSDDVQRNIIHFGYRNNLISGEMYFSDGVVLVEGASEEVLYKKLCQQAGIDLDFYNIRIIPVFGIGFEAYASLLDALKIPYAIRTDNDVYERDGKTYHQGVNRLASFLAIKKQTEPNPIKPYNSDDKPADLGERIKAIIEESQKFGVFMSYLDLESDLCNVLEENGFFEKYNYRSKKQLLEFLYRKKATNMFLFIQEAIDISILNETEIMLPVKYLLGIINGKENG